MRYRLDAKVLVSWIWQPHKLHFRTAHWLERMLDQPENRLLACSISEIGFVRVIGLVTRQANVPRGAGRLLQKQLKTLGEQHAFLADHVDRRTWPEWCRYAGQTTDVPLVRLAARHSAPLAILDDTIPEAFIIQERSF